MPGSTAPQRSAARSRCINNASWTCPAPFVGLSGMPCSQPPHARQHTCSRRSYNRPWPAPLSTRTGTPRMRAMVWELASRTNLSSVPVTTSTGKLRARRQHVSLRPTTRAMSCHSALTHERASPEARCGECSAGTWQHSAPRTPKSSAFAQSSCGVCGQPAASRSTPRRQETPPRTATS